MSTEIDQEIAPGIRLRFDTAKALSTFLTEEKERWDAVSLAATRHPSMRDRAVKAQSRRLNAMLTQVAQAVANRPADWAKQLGGLQHFSDQHTNGRILCSLIPADAAVLNLIETDPDAAVIGMSARQREEDTVGVINPHDRADAVLALGRFTIAGAGRPAEAGSFATLSDMVNQAMTGWKNEVARAADLAKGGAREAKKISDAVTTQAGAQATAHNEMLDAHKTALEAIKAQFLSEMSLRAPVEYWKDRAAAGQKTAWNWLKAFVASALILFGLVLWQGPGLLSLLKDTNGQISLVAVPLLLAALVPLLWVLRHMARMFADNIADARDAAQRSALTSTFLALSTQEKVSFSDNERAIIVQALFRPSPAQPTEDGVPVPLLELLRRP